jgi:AcrR family transcriptional regulator
MIEAKGTARVRLLDATLDVLRSHGLTRATSREIASRAGTNLQAITYHFGSKEQLIAQALVHAVRSWVEPARLALQHVADDPLGRLVESVMALRATLAEALPHLPAYFEALAAAPRNDAVRTQIVGLIHELRDDLAARIAELREAGIVADWVKPKDMAALIVAAGDGLALHTMLDPDGIDADLVLDQVIQLLLAARTQPS